MKEWECFCDKTYYDMWAVRPAGENRWGHCFHVVSRGEAEGLRDFLNNTDPATVGMGERSFKEWPENASLERAKRSDDTLQDIVGNSAESIARAKWNAEADEYNQWDNLGQDEKNELIANH